MDIMYEQIGIHSREMETKKVSNRNLRSEMKSSLEVITDWTIEKVSELADKSIEISQTKAQSEKIYKELY